jgi:tetraprenyl-beta-curcumene synthase
MPGSRWPSAERLWLLAAFVLAALRYWLTVFPRVGWEVRRWRRSAAQIPDTEARRLALDALAKRSNLEGAAAFATFVPWRKRRAAVRALVAFQAIYNYADLLAEQPSLDPVGAARRLHQPLRLALEPSGELPAASEPAEVTDARLTDTGPTDAGSPDAEHLAALVSTCRRALADLPCYPLVAARAQLGAERIQAFQSLSLGPPHELERWVRQAEPPLPAMQLAGSDLAWWELAAAAGSSLTVNALIAAAARADLCEDDVATIEVAYFPSICALHSLLDSLVDESEDAATGQLSLIGCYASRAEAAAGLARLAERALRQVRELPAPNAHVLLVTAMACSYLAAAPEAATLRDGGEAMRVATRAAFGPLASPVLLIFRLRRLLARSSPTAPLAAGRSVPQPAPLDAEPRGADARAA